MIEKIYFGKTQNNEDVYKYVLKSDVAEASILTYGATWQNFKYLVDGKMINTAFGYDDITSYETMNGNFGALVGRNANRIKGGKFVLSGVEYEVPLTNDWNNLHSGAAAFNKHMFEVEEVNEQENSITLKYFSEDLDGGFPGNLNFKVKYTLLGGALSIEYFAVSDKDTIMNPTNHAYFNLGCDMLETELKINSSFFTLAEEHLHTTGEIKSVKETPFDFTEFKAIGKDIDADDEQLKLMGGYDVNYCLSSFKEYKKVAVAKNPFTGLTLNVYTDRPGLQLYTSNFLTERFGLNGEKYDKRTAFCLETQTYSGAAKHPHFPTPFIKASEEFYSKTTYELKIEK